MRQKLNPIQKFVKGKQWKTIDNMQRFLSRGKIVENLTIKNLQNGRTMVCIQGAGLCEVFYVYYHPHEEDSTYYDYVTLWQP